MMQLIGSALPEFLQAALNTVIYCVVSFPLAILLGVLLTAMLASPSVWLSQPARILIEVMRCTPMITQILLIYYGVGAILVAVDLSRLVNAWSAGIFALVLNYGAYEAEVIRAGFQSVEAGQSEAALSLGMTGEQRFRRIVLPQAIPLMIPPLANDFIYLLKDSAIVSVIAGGELTSVMQSWVIRNSSNPLPLYALGLLLYLLMSLPVSYLSQAFERKLRANL
jgi:glutamine transport system permease protein